MKILFFLLIGCTPLHAFVQPVLKPAEYIIYLSPNGNDANNGDSLHPVGSFKRALELCAMPAPGRTGQVYCAISVDSGTYIPRERIDQIPAFYKPLGENGPVMNISIIGKGKVIIDGKNIDISGGQGLLRLCGSHIQISNLYLKNSNAFGLVLGNTFARSKHVLVQNITIDSTYSHGLLMGDNESGQSDTVHIRHCSFLQTNRSNAGGTTNSWGSALKMFGASDVLIQECYFSRNWGEAISVNECKRVEIKNCTVYNNWGAGIYCDIANDITIYGNIFHSTGDTVVTKPGKRGMMAILCSNEAYTAFKSEYRTERIYIYSNLFVNCAGMLDLWEGAVSFLQKGIVRDIYFALNTCIGLQSGENDNNAGFINIVHSMPYPLNREFANIQVYGNIFFADTQRWPLRQWIRAGDIAQQAMTFKNNVWNYKPSALQQQDFISPVKTIQDPFQNTNLNPELMRYIEKPDWAVYDINNTLRVNPTLAGAYERSASTGLLHDQDFSDKLMQQNEIYSGITLSGFINMPESLHALCCTITDISGRVYQHIKRSSAKEPFYLPFTGFYILRSCSID
jgi:parallel beta-helix repeat protein